MAQMQKAQVNIGSFRLAFRFGEKIFCVALQSACPSRKRRGKTPRQICYVSYREWALKLMKIQQEVTFKHCNYLEEMPNYIRVLVTNDV